MAFFPDLQYSARSLARAPGLACALLLTIALGIGSNAVVQGFVRGLATRERPIPGAGSIVSLFHQDAEGAAGPMSAARYRTLGHAGSFAWVGAAREAQRTVVLDNREAVTSMAEVTPAIANWLQLPLHNGVVVSHAWWITQLGGRKDVTGQAIRVDGVDTTIAAIAPEWLDGLYVGGAVDVWQSLEEQSLDESVGESRTLWALAQLPRGVSASQAQAAASAIAGDAHTLVLPYTGVTPEMSMGLSRIAALLRTAAGAVFFMACANVAMFLLARASARSSETSVRVALGAGRSQLARQLLADSVLISIGGGVFGVLLAMWTTRIIPALFFDRDAAQLVFAPDATGVALAAAACLTITIACGLVPLVEMRDDRPAAVLQRENAGPSRTMRRVRAGLVAAQMACCCLLVIATLLILQGFRTALRTTVGGRLGNPVLATVHARPQSTRGEAAASGFEYLRQIEQEAHSVTSISLTAWANRIPGSRPAWQALRIEPAGLATREVEMDVVSFTPRLLERIALPPVAGRIFGAADAPGSCRVVLVNATANEELFEGDAVGRSIEDPAGLRAEIIGVVAPRDAPGEAVRERPAVFYYAQQTAPPLDREGPARFLVAIRPAPPRTLLDAYVVSRGYFGAMGLQPVAGDIFPDGPAAGSCRVGLVNEDAAETYFGGHAVGAAVIDNTGRRTTIVGVVEAPALRVSARQTEPSIYFPMSQDFLPRMMLMLGARDVDQAMIATMRRQLRSVPGAFFEPAVTTLDDHLSRTALAPERIATVLVGAAAVMAFTLGILGVYGVMAESARVQRREIALRIALGAQGWRVLRQVLGEGVRLAAAGTVAGLIASLAAVRWLARVTLNAEVVNLWMWLAATLVLAAAVAIASLLPARRALRADPLTIMTD